jgi:hypothetical protein
MLERREVRVETRDGRKERDEGGEGTDKRWKREGRCGYRRGMEEKTGHRGRRGGGGIQMRDGREEGGEGRDEGWKRGGR